MGIRRKKNFQEILRKHNTGTLHERGGIFKVDMRGLSWANW